MSYHVPPVLCLSFHWMMCVLCVDDVAACISLVHDMLNHNIIPDEYIYHGLIKANSHGGSYHDCLEVVTSMKQANGMGVSFKHGHGYGHEIYYVIHISCFLYVT